MASLLVWGLVLPWVVPLGVDSVLRAFFLLTRCCIRASRDRPVGSSESRPLRFAVVIPAHDEADALAVTLPALERLAYPREAWQVFVIADACTDETAAITRQAGAVCLEKPGPAPQGKGRALQWFWACHGDRLQSFDVLVVLDADSRVEPSFLTALADAFHRGVERVQTWVQPVPESARWASVLAAYSEWLSQEVDDRACRYWGWPVRFRGTGMAFRVDTLRGRYPVLRTKVEDVELTLWGLRQGSIEFVPTAVVYDPKPATARGFTRQRARWLQGQWEVFRHYGRDIGRLLVRGMGTWACILALLGRPKVGALMGRLCLFLVVVFFLPTVGWLQKALTIFLGGALVVDVVYYGLGLLWADRPSLYARALIRAPLYVLLWLWSGLVAVGSRHPWLRARD
ncbi:MAG: glycosyltransferase [Acidobacteria bacterium]|nr:glycosyltransferase [Acidobacteriota bacterium]